MLPSEECRHHLVDGAHQSLLASNSHLLASIYLHVLDRELARRNASELVRYAR